jgi:hypothetical protein
MSSPEQMQKFLDEENKILKVENNATGTTDITNSEIAYLGCEDGKRKGGLGLLSGRRWKNQRNEAIIADAIKQL